MTRYSNVSERVRAQIVALMDGQISKADTSSEMLRLEGLVKRYGRFTAVNGIDLTVPSASTLRLRESAAPRTASRVAHN